MCWTVLKGVERTAQANKMSPAASRSTTAPAARSGSACLPYLLGLGLPDAPVPTPRIRRPACAAPGWLDWVARQAGGGALQRGASTQCKGRERQVGSARVVQGTDCWANGSGACHPCVPLLQQPLPDALHASVTCMHPPPPPRSPPPAPARRRPWNPASSLLRTGCTCPSGSPGRWRWWCRLAWAAPAGRAPLRCVDRQRQRQWGGGGGVEALRCP